MSKQLTPDEIRARTLVLPAERKKGERRKPLPAKWRRHNVDVIRNHVGHDSRVQICFWAFIYGAISMDDWKALCPAKATPMRRRIVPAGGSR